MSWENPPDDDWDEQAAREEDEERWDEGHSLDEEEHPEDFYEPRAHERIQQDPGMAPLAAIVCTGRDTAEELAAVPTEWAWQDYAPAGAITMMAGQPGGGKTTLLFQILVARARVESGVCLICDRNVLPARQFKHVLLIEAEHSDASTARKLLKSCDILGISRNALDRITWIARKSVLIGDTRWKLIVQLIADGSVSDIAIDTLARVSPRESESNDEMSQVEIFDGLAQAIEAAPDDQRPTVWLLGHTRKQSKESKGRLGLDDVAGSLQRTGQADAVITVEAVRNEGMVVATKIVLQKSREDPEEYPEEYEMHLPEAPKPAAAPRSSDAADVARVQEYFKEHPGAGVEQVRQALSMSWRRVKSIQAQLKKDGSL
jgi:hypothetical protein